MALTNPCKLYQYSFFILSDLDLGTHILSKKRQVRENFSIKGTNALKIRKPMPLNLHASSFTQSLTDLAYVRLTSNRFVYTVGPWVLRKDA